MAKRRSRLHFCPYHSCQAYMARSAPVTYANYYTPFCVFYRQSSARPSWSSRDWYVEQNSESPQIFSTKCPVTTKWFSPVLLGGWVWVWEVKPGLFEWNYGNFPSSDVSLRPMEEGQENPPPRGISTSVQNTPQGSDSNSSDYTSSDIVGHKFRSYWRSLKYISF